MPRRLGYPTAFVLAQLFTGAPPASAADPSGTWLTQQEDARIQIAPCGQRICGTVVWLKQPIDPATGKPHIDDKNPDPGKQSRRIIGLRIFSMAPTEADIWAGNIYNSDDGQTYAATIRLPGLNRLEVQGCAGPFCGSEIWSRR